MRHLVTGTERYLTSDPIADGVMDLAAALTEVGRTEVAEFPFLDGDRASSIRLLIGANVTVVTVDQSGRGHADFEVPHDAVAGHLRARAEAVRNPAADALFTPEELAPLTEHKDW